MEDTPLWIVEDQETLLKTCDLLAQESVIGVDTESDSMHHYREKVCLIQISDRQRDYILDPLKIPDMSPLGAVFADSGIVKVFHGADYDLLCMNRDFNFQVNNLFDTMLAAQFLDMPRVGLADLCGEYFDTEMDKRYQRHDWSERPLKPEHLEYARGDSHYLLALRELLLFKLVRIERADIIAEEFALLAQKLFATRESDADGWIRMKRIGHLEDSDRRVLRHLWRLRDEHAREMDRPPYKVFPDPVLILLAEKKPTSIETLKQHLRSSSTMVRRYGDQMVEAIRRGLEDADPLPEAQKRGEKVRYRYGGRESERLFEHLKTWRAEVMKRERLPLVMVASNTHLKALAGNRPRTLKDLEKVEDIRQWQIRRYGEEILALLNRFGAESDGRRELKEQEAPAPSRRRRRR